jgi:hypothetical protein
MSAIDIIEQIKTLPSDEQAKVKAWFSVNANSEPAQPEIKYVSDEMFQRAEDHVFKHYGSLLEQLAK